MVIARIDPGSDRRWQTFVENRPDAGIFHTSACLEALRQTYGYEPVVYAATDRNGLVNGVPFCLIRSRLTGRRLVSSFFRPLPAARKPLKSCMNCS